MELPAAKQCGQTHTRGLSNEAASRQTASRVYYTETVSHLRLKLRVRAESHSAECHLRPELPKEIGEVNRPDARERTELPERPEVARHAQSFHDHEHAGEPAIPAAIRIDHDNNERMPQSGSKAAPSRQAATTTHQL